MNEVVRRLLMMVGIIAIGTFLILSDASLIVTISASVAFGIIMTMGLGLLKIEDFKKITAPKNTTTENSAQTAKTEKPQPKKERKNFFSKGIFSRFKKNNTKNQKDKKKNSPGKEPTETKSTRISAGLAAAIGSFSTTIAKARDKKHTEKLDSLLNTAIDEPITSASDAKEPSDGIDSFDDEDFGSLDSLEIEGEELSFDSDMDLPATSSSHQNDDSDEFNMDNEINSILLAAGETPEGADGEFALQAIEDGLDEGSFINLPDAVSDIQHANLNDSLNELENLTEFDKDNFGADELSDFDAIDLDELETDDLSIETDEIIIEEEEEVDDGDILPDDHVSLQDKKISGNEISHLGNTNLGDLELDEAVSFSRKNEYDDILSVLESDIKKVKKGPEPSLLRDMKDVHVEAKDLVEELEKVLHSMGGKSRQINNQNDRSEE
ncbi:hypothetical protein [Methanogenium sp. MK-MG]|uniref:hypothetical protein n=1 Tax=Methanogenium sp. MK-MG TaxID=2599926 RepID=UPI0013EA9602|nr:hypothetical protein [Methanogenium sp. MK-MG]KAF1078438.1 hypothetical protein MKMG_00686 [Methanogenium sp. MK-MG]